MTNQINARGMIEQICEGFDFLKARGSRFGKDMHRGNIVRFVIYILILQFLATVTCLVLTPKEYRQSICLKLHNANIWLLDVCSILFDGHCAGLLVDLIYTVLFCGVFIAFLVDDIDGRLFNGLVANFFMGAISTVRFRGLQAKFYGPPSLMAAIHLLPDLFNH